MSPSSTSDLVGVVFVTQSRCGCCAVPPEASISGQHLHHTVGEGVVVSTQSLQQEWPNILDSLLADLRFCQLLLPPHRLSSLVSESLHLPSRQDHSLPTGFALTFIESRVRARKHIQQGQPRQWLSRISPRYFIENLTSTMISSTQTGGSHPPHPSERGLMSCIDCQHFGFMESHL
ncbi:uncharacterized protein LOC143151388 [Ptiloglossa arizonensis]|uniref:uncharacterized protein LOC143151388 n=1 Tax=Ptiloglossa arizonensis TaxID=3350558 RepID=UPI003FA12433